MADTTFTRKELTDRLNDASEWGSLIDCAQIVFNSMSTYGWDGYGNGGVGGPQGEREHARDKIDWHRDQWHKRSQSSRDRRMNVIAIGRRLGMPMSRFVTFTRELDEWLMGPPSHAMAATSQLDYEERLRTEIFHKERDVVDDEVARLIDEINIQLAILGPEKKAPAIPSPSTAVIGVREALAAAGVVWLTEADLVRLHRRADENVHIATQLLGVLAVSQRRPDLYGDLIPSIESWMHATLIGATASVLFPDILSSGHEDWERLAPIWDGWMAHQREYIRTGRRVLGEPGSWARREAVRAAWNIEFAQCGGVYSVATLTEDSAHRLALRLLPDLFTDYSLLVQQSFDAYPVENSAADYDADKAFATAEPFWRPFRAKWLGDAVDEQCRELRATLASELHAFRTRVFPAAKTDEQETQPAKEPKRIELTTAERIHLAIGKLREDPSRTAKSIAQEVGVAPSTLSKSSVWQVAVSAATANPPPLGVRRTDGTVDAIDAD